MGNNYIPPTTVSGIDNKYKSARESRNSLKQLGNDHSNCNTKFLKSLRLPKIYTPFFDLFDEVCLSSNGKINVVC